MLKELREKIEFLSGQNTCLEAGISSIIKRFQETGDITTQFLIYDLPNQMETELKHRTQSTTNPINESFREGFQSGMEAIASLLPPSRN